MFLIIASCISVSQSVSLFVYSWSAVWPFCEATVLNSTSPCFLSLISYKENTYRSRHPYIVLISFNLIFDLYYTPCFKPWWNRSNMATLCFKNSFQNARTHTHTHTPSSPTDRIVAVNACRVTDRSGFKAQGPHTGCIVFIRTHSAHYKTHHLLYYLYARDSFFEVCKWPIMMKGGKTPSLATVAAAAMWARAVSMVLKHAAHFRLRSVFWEVNKKYKQTNVCMAVKLHTCRWWALESLLSNL